MKILLLALLVVFVLFPAGASAQSAATSGAPGAPPPRPHPPMPDGKWWKNSEVARELQLSETQVNQIEQTFFEHRLKLIDLRAELERQETRLQPLIEAAQPEEAKVGAQIDLVLAARGKLEKANAMMMLAIRRALNVEQWKKLEEFKHRREGRGEGRPQPPLAHFPPRPPEDPDR